MNKILKNKKLLIAFVGVLLLIAILILIFVNNRQPANFVKTMLTDIKTGDTNKITKYLQTDQIEENSEENASENNEFKILLEKMEYDIVSSKKSGNTGKVVVSISNKNIETTLRNYFSTAFAEMLKNITSNSDSNELESKLDSYLKEEYEKAETVTTKIEITLTKDAEGWRVEQNEENINEVLNAILPGYLSYVNAANF